jgi:type VI secretion system protein VasI
MVWPRCASVSRAFEVIGLSAGIRGLVAAAAFSACLAAPALAQDLCAGNSTEEGCEPAELSEEASNGVTSGGWTVFEETSSLTSIPTIVVQNESSDVITGLFGSIERVSLVIQCQQNTTSVYFNFGENFMSDVGGRGQLAYRVDNRVPASRSMTASEDNSSLGLFGGLVAIPFVRELFGAESLLIRVQTFEDQPIEATFTLTGLDEAIGPLRGRCNW